MKKLIVIGLILILAVGGFYIAYDLFRMAPETLSSIDISDTESGDAKTYVLDSVQMENLFSGLTGTFVQSLPDTPVKAFTMTLSHVRGYKRVYTVYFDAQQQVYMQSMKTNKIFIANQPAFFNSFEGFDSLYPYRIGPDIPWTLSGEPVIMENTSKAWSFLKRDDLWYSGAWGLGEGVPEAIKGGVNPVNSADALLSFHPDIPPTSVNCEILDENNRSILKQKLTDYSIPIIGKDGVYHYRVEMAWSDPAQPYKGKYACQFTVSVDLPVVFEISESTVTQGEIAIIYAYHVNEDQTPILNQKLFGAFQFYKDGDAYVGYLPTGYFTAPGEYKLEYGVEGGESAESILTVKARSFNIQRLTIDPTVEASTRNDAAYAEYDKYFKPVRLTSDEERYYSEPFSIPAAGRLTTEFGETRHVNGSPTSYRHSGLDIAALTGTPVYAANRGKVVLSMYLILTGNTIVIDHGQGLFSVYFHMDKRQVESNTMVENDHQIGTVGSTGFSTGPHLHFTMSYYETNIEPGYFLAGEPITTANYKEYLK